MPAKTVARSVEELKQELRGTSITPRLLPSGKMTFEYKWRDVAGRQKTKNSADLEWLMRFRLETLDRKKEGKPQFRRKDVPTLEDFALRWLKGKKKLEDSTRENYAHLLTAHILPELGDLPLVDLRPRVLAEWQEARLEAGAGPYRIGRAQGLLAQILRTAVLPHEYLDVNPVDALDRPEYEKKAHRWLTAPEVEKLRTWYLEREDYRSAALISCLAYVGPRPQDFLGGEWVNLDPTPPRWMKRLRPGEGSGSLLLPRRNSRGQLREGSKSRESELVPVYVPGPVMEDLARWDAERRKSRILRGSPFMFPRDDGALLTKDDYDNWRERPIKRDGRPVDIPKGLCGCGCGERTPIALRSQTDRGWMKGEPIRFIAGHHKKSEVITGGERRDRCFKAAAEDSGLGADLKPYDLRHTAASLCAAAGFGEVEIGHQLRHSPATSNRLYKHLIHGELPEEGTLDDYIHEARGQVPGKVVVHV